MPRRRFELTREQVDDYLEECFANQTQPRVSDLASRLSISRLVLSRTFKRNEGGDLSAYFAARRHDRAVELLHDPELDTGTISACSGHGSLRTLYRCFARRDGVAPAKMRERLRHSHRGSERND